MSRVEQDTPLLPSLLDRLIDTEPDVSTEPLWAQSYHVRQLLQEVRRDLENLLNTRRTYLPSSEDFRETVTSVLAYGLPEFTSAGLGYSDDHEKLCEAVKETIRRFEPRLTHVRVRTETPPNKFDRSVHLTIDSVLHVQPIVEPVTFDTVVATTTGNCSVNTRL